MHQVSAYIPCFNNRETIAEVIDSIRGQTVQPTEIVVVDDASTDDSVEVARSAGARVVVQPSNMGRGPARRRGMDETTAPFVVCCDATNVLPTDFIARGLAWMQNTDVAAAFGRISQKPGGGAVIRWRGRHLFKSAAPRTSASESEAFATYGAVVRRAAVEAVGNYDVSLRHTEDAELGGRLLKGGWKIIRDPDLVVYSIARNSLSQVLERYWRWNAGKDEAVSWSGYARLVSYSVKSMAWGDLRDGEIACAMISLYCPHHQFWTSWWRRRRRKVQA